jgi:hypothetical protein
MADLIEQLLEYLQANQTDPLTYLLILFLFSVAAAIFLPIPIEIGLVWNPGMFFPLKAITLGLGKATGAAAVFYIPSEVGAAARWFKGRISLRRKRRSRSPSDESNDPDATGGDATVAQKRPSVPLAPTPPRWGWLRWLTDRSERFTRRYGIIAMYVIMSIPGMLDTIPLYIFSIINKEQTLMRLRDFVLANLLAGVNRAFLIYALLNLLGIRLF